MKACYTSSLFFDSLRPSFWKYFKKKNDFNIRDYFEKFKASGFERALFTLEMYRAAQKQVLFTAAEICIYVESKEAHEHLDFLTELHREGVKILLGGEDALALQERARYPIFEEVIFWVHRIPSNESLDLLAKIPRLCWLLSYNMPENLVQRFLEKLAKKSISRNASRYLELHSQGKADFWLSPETEIILNKKSGHKIASSIVIPFQDNIDELLVTLNFLTESLQKSQEFEIVLVDDSYSAQHQVQLKKHVAAFDQDVVYLKLKRKQARKRGDHLFRAGVARNYGATIAAGQELVFMDSDILLGKEFWNQIAMRRSQSQSLLMPKRFYLNSNFDSEKLSFDQLKVGEHTQLSWGGHWEDFYRSPLEEAQPWKWTSTFCLAIPKNVFFEVGGFRKGFFCYGFEDTDLGYRLQAKGFKLQILDAYVFHLPIQSTRSEYAGQVKLRKMIMKESFKVFQRSVLDPELTKIFGHIIDL